jgi:HSP20 family protein
MIPALRNNVFDLFYKDMFDLERSYFGDSNVKETETGFTISIDLPGVEKDQIKLKYDKGYLTVEAQREPTTGRYGKFTKSYRFQDNIEDEINASFKNGVLTIVTKKEKSKERLISIE